MKNETVHPYLASWFARHPEQMPLGLMAVDTTGRILEATPRAAEMCGMTKEDLTGASLDDTPIPLDVEALRTPGNTICFTLQRMDGEFDLRCTCTGTTSNETGNTAAIVILEETPGASAADSVRIQLEKLASIDNLVAGVAHELNNPLTAVLGYAQLLLHKTQDETTRKRLVAIAEESQRCHRIVQNLLTFADRNKGEKVMTDVNRLLADTMALCRYQMQVDHIEVRLDLADAPAMVLADLDELRRVFLNLMSNAHHALTKTKSDDRRLEVSTTVKGDSLYITFLDTGAGVPREIRHRIFDPFFTTRPLGEGMGLGLSVAFGIIQDHGGRIWLDPSENAGGAAFQLELPLAT